MRFTRFLYFLFLLVYVNNPSRKSRELIKRQDGDGTVDGGYSHKKYENYSFIDIHKKVFENEKNTFKKNVYFFDIVYYEAHRDYHSGSIKRFPALKQIGMPDDELKEAKWDLFKISMSDIVRNSLASRIKCEYQARNFSNNNHQSFI